MWHAFELITNFNKNNSIPTSKVTLMINIEAFNPFLKVTQITSVAAF